MKYLLLALPYDDHLRLDGIVRAGVPVRILREIASLLELDRPTLAWALRVSGRTLERRLAGTSRNLPLAESDRAVRLGRLIAKALFALGDRDRAAKWFKEPRSILRNKSALELSTTDAGARVVVRALERIERRRAGQK